MGKQTVQNEERSVVLVMDKRGMVHTMPKNPRKRFLKAKRILQ